MTEQWSDRSGILNHKTLPPSGPLSYLRGSALKTWTSYWKREGSTGMDMWNASTVQSRHPLTYRLMESVGLRGPRWLGSSWQRGIAESESSQLSTLMIETPGDLMWDLPCAQQASCLEGGPLLWIWPLYLQVNQKYDDDDDEIDYTNSIPYHVKNCSKWLSLNSCNAVKTNHLNQNSTCTFPICPQKDPLKTGRSWWSVTNEWMTDRWTDRGKS